MEFGYTYKYSVVLHFQFDALVKKLTDEVKKLQQERDEDDKQILHFTQELNNSEKNVTTKDAQ